MATPKADTRGDLYLRIMIQVPPDANDEVKEGVRTMDAAYPMNVRSELRL